MENINLTDLINSINYGLRQLQICVDAESETSSAYYNYRSNKSQERYKHIDSDVNVGEVQKQLSIDLNEIKNSYSNIIDINILQYWLSELNELNVPDSLLRLDTLVRIVKDLISERKPTNQENTIAPRSDDNDGWDR